MVLIAESHQGKGKLSDRNERDQCRILVVYQNELGFEYVLFTIHNSHYSSNGTEWSVSGRGTFIPKLKEHITEMIYIYNT